MQEGKNCNAHEKKKKKKGDVKERQRRKISERVSIVGPGG
jgi:hypothetical protein